MIPRENAIRSLKLGLILPPTIVDTLAPHMHAIMNKAKITPCGGGISVLSRDGVHLKTNANIAPSKHETMMPASKMFLSVRRSLRAWQKISLASAPVEEP